MLGLERSKLRAFDSVLSIFLIFNFKSFSENHNEIEDLGRDFQAFKLPEIITLAIVS
jgi:hypothetical protein